MNSSSVHEPVWMSLLEAFELPPPPKANTAPTPTSRMIPSAAKASTYMNVRRSDSVRGVCRC